MLSYIGKRLLYFIPVFLVVSFLSFLLVTAPSGDYMTTYQTRLQNRAGLSRERALKLANRMREKHGLDRPFFIRYVDWIYGIVSRGDFGPSFTYSRPVSEVIWGRLGGTLLVTLPAQLLAVLGGIIPGVYSATHQYEIGDNVFTFFAFLGLSIPNFFFALILVYILTVWFGIQSVGGLISSRFVFQPWSLAKFIDLLKHLWVPVLVVGTAGMARNMRVMRGNLLDVLQKQYTQVAKSKGLPHRIVIYKHAVTNAIQPIIMQLGMSLPWLLQGTIVAGIVLNLPTIGPVFHDALINEDIYLASSFILMYTTLLVIGNLFADIILAWIDPRIRYE